MSNRVERLEKLAAIVDGKFSAVYLLANDDPLPDGVSEDDPGIMVIRLIGVEPRFDEAGRMVPSSE